MLFHLFGYQTPLHLESIIPAAIFVFEGLYWTCRNFEALEQLSLSKRYKNIACKLKESICKQMTIDGPFGEQFWRNR